MAKDIRKVFKMEHKTLYHPSVHIKLSDEWYNSTFTGSLYKYYSSFPSILLLLNKYISKDPKALMITLRKEINKLVKLLSDADFNNLLIDFNAVSKSKIKTREGLQKQIKNTSSDFDDLTLNLLSKVLNVDFVIFDESTMTMRDLTDSDSIQDNILFIYKGVDGYSVVGYRSDQEISDIHSRKQLPREIDAFLDKHNYFLGLIRAVFDMKSKVNLSVLYESLRGTLGVDRLLDSDIKLINKLTGVLLETSVFVKK
ncbi:hypothetical protein SAGO17_00118 [Mimivirus AB-566-O17]|uniref:Uncharacterized protein n=1 Tax=Mimivirus AB-566-O17 TaxID=1988039 RepID=A0A1X9VNZ3_9VIRU|nr:hypothetical protein SAGO17_00118 [Mimivirus AB-566-O17]